jgi:hypothetical protein
MFRLVSVFVLAMTLAMSSVAGEKQTSKKFEGAKANTGTVTLSVENGKGMLMVSDDFIVPDTPDPHWQIVDSRGTVYLLQRFDIKGDKVNRSIVVPSYIKDIAKVQVWCAWAETLLGETTFGHTVKIASR